MQTTYCSPTAASVWKYSTICGGVPAMTMSPTGDSPIP